MQVIHSHCRGLHWHDRVLCVHFICSFACMHTHTYECLCLAFPPCQMADVWHKPIPQGHLVLPDYYLHLAEFCRPGWPLMSASHTLPLSCTPGTFCSELGPMSHCIRRPPGPWEEGSAVHGGSVTEGSPKPMGFRLNQHPLLRAMERPGWVWRDGKDIGLWFPLRQTES